MNLGISGRKAITCALSKGLGRAYASSLACYSDGAVTDGFVHFFGDKP